MSNFNDSEVQKGLEEFDSKVEAALAMYCETAAKTLESHAKTNRPWTDRSSRARQTLTGSSEINGTKGRIVLAQGVDYGLWLELAHEKRFAIVEPTVRLKSNEIVRGLEHLVERLKL